MGRITKSSLSAFQEWHDRNQVHVNRHMSIIDRQTNVFKAYIDVLQSYPTDSEQFASEIKRLHSLIGQLADEMREVTDSFAQDCSDFVEMLEILHLEMLSSLHE